MTDNLPAVQQQRAAAPLAGDILSNPAIFEHTWRVAKAFAGSSLVPKHMQGKPENCMVALDMARILHENPLVVLQNIYFVNDRPGWNSSYLIGKLNKSGLIKGRLGWRLQGAGDGLQVTACATDAGTGEEITETVGMAMAIAEGWTRNPKYKSMPELMLKYRSAAFLIRLYYPDILSGLPAIDEVEDMTLAAGADGVFRPVAPAADLDPFEAASAGRQVEAAPVKESLTAQTVEPVVAPSATTAAPAQTAKPDPATAAPELALVSEPVGDPSRPAPIEIVTPDGEVMTWADPSARDWGAATTALAGLLGGARTADQLNDIWASNEAFRQALGARGDTKLKTSIENAYRNRNAQLAQQGRL